jgi:hypothetical protein
MEPDSSLPHSPVLILRHINPIHTTPSYLSKIHLRLRYPSLWFSYQQIIRVHLLPHSCYMPRQSHPLRLNNSNYTWRRVQISKLHVMQCPVTSFLFCPNILLSTLFSNTLSLCSALNVIDQVSHPYRTTGKIVILYIHIFTFFDSRREYGRFWTEW